MLALCPRPQPTCSRVAPLSVFYSLSCFRMSALFCSLARASLHVFLPATCDPHVTQHPVPPTCISTALQTHPAPSPSRITLPGRFPSACVFVCLLQHVAQTGLLNSFWDRLLGTQPISPSLSPRFGTPQMLRTSAKRQEEVRQPQATQKGGAGKGEEQQVQEEGAQGSNVAQGAGAARCGRLGQACRSSTAAGRLKMSKASPWWAINGRPRAQSPGACGSRGQRAGCARTWSRRVGRALQGVKAGGARGTAASEGARRLAAPPTQAARSAAWALQAPALPRSPNRA